MEKAIRFNNEVTGNLDNVDGVKNELDYHNDN